MTWLGFKAVRQWRQTRLSRWDPVIREVLAAHIGGVDRTADLQLLRKRQARRFEESLVDLLRTAPDPARERLAALALRLDFVWKWEKEFRSRRASRRREAVERLGLTGRVIGHATLIAALGDVNDLVKLEAAHALVRWGGPSDIETVFRAATRQSPPVRGIMTDALRRYAPALAAEALPAILGSAETQQGLVALEIFSKWGRSPTCQL